MLNSYSVSWRQASTMVQRMFLTFLIAAASLSQSAFATCTINGGVIGNPQSGCGSFDPTAITNVTSVSSQYGGPFAFIWLKTTDQNAVNGANTNWTVVSGATGHTYDPGVVTQTTWYRRCARRNVSECPDYDGESNWVKMTVNAAINATVSANATITAGQSTTLTATGGGTYAWSNGGNTASISVSPAVTTIYSVTVSNNGCTAVKSVTVTVNPSVPVADCNNIGIVVGNGSITVNGVSGAPIVSIQVYDAAWATVFNQFYTNSPGTINVPNLASGNYYVKVQYLTAAWVEICKKDQFVAVVGVVVPTVPTVSISDVTVNENAGSASLQICASAVSASPITVTYTTTNGTAMVGMDYTTTTATATIPAGQLCATVTFPIVDNNTNEPTEFFNVTLSGPNGATIGDGAGTVTITDNDAVGPVGGDCSTITITPANGSVAIGGLSNPGGITVIQAYDANWNQKFNEYYTVTPASVSIPNLAGGNYFVKVQYLTNAWVEICKKEVVVTVGGGASVPTLSISDITVNENAGTASLQICASAVSTSPITVTYSTVAASAVAATDYTAKTAVATIPAGQTCVTVTFNITDDGVQEALEVFHVYLSNPNGATIGDLEGLVTIIDNDSAPVGGDCATATIVAGNGSIAVGNLSNPGGITIIQAYDANWNQVFNQYYTTTPASVAIPSLAGGNYFVKVQYLTNAWVEICKKEVVVTVAGAPVAPTVSISDVTVNENAGTASLQICASAASASPITVTYTTSNGTAMMGTDYTTTTATATIPAGQTCTTVTFPIVDNTTNEPTELFNVTLSGPNGATIADGAGTVTILDNDAVTPSFDCNTATVVAGSGSIVVGNLLAAPIVIVQVSDPSWNQIFNQYYTTTPGTVTIPVTASGTYYVKVQYLNANWTEICKKEVYLPVVVTPTGPVCNVTRNATNNILRDGANCTLGSQAYGMWFNTHFPGTTDPRYSVTGTTFVENADGTATLTGTATNNQNGNVKFALNVNFCGRTYAAPAGSPKMPCYSANTNGWYYYTTTCGTLTGQGAAAGTNLAITRRGEAFQVGAGANLNENVFGASGWFNIYVTSGAAAGLNEGDFNINLSGAATAPSCGTGTANCSTVACYQVPTTTFPNPSVCYRVVNKETGAAVDTDNHPNATVRPIDGSSSQSWRFIQSSEANYFFITSNSTSATGQVLGLENCSSADGAIVKVVAASGSDCTKFRLQDAGSGFYYIVNKVSGKGLKIGGSNIYADGAHMIQLPIDVNNQHQKWKLETVTCTYASVVSTASVNLSAQRQGNAVELRWMSHTGTQNATYVVERSLDGQSFEVIATGNATSQDETVSFRNEDATPAKGINIYRVRMVLKSGLENISNEQKVNMPTVGSFGLYPNPAAELVTLDASDFAGQNVSVTIFNQLGKLIKTIEVGATNGIIEIELGDLNSGFYGVSIESNGVKRSAKLLVAKN
jgi:Ricin-type beta-trefoil lectin domain-like/Calx-beta domain/Secretion system C-terminal sorting domain